MAGADERAVGADERAVGADEPAVGAGRDPVAVVAEGDGAGVGSAVVLPVPLPPPVVPATTKRTTRPSAIQLATCAHDGSDRKRRHQPGPCPLLLTGGPPFPTQALAERMARHRASPLGTTLTRKYPTNGNLMRP